MPVYFDQLIASNNLPLWKNELNITHFDLINIMK